MAHVPQIRIPASYLRGGTSKGVFFRLQDLPERAQVPGAARDALLLRVIGSPDCLWQADRRHGARHLEHQQRSVILSSEQPARSRCPITCSARVSTTRPLVDWSGNCGILSAAVGAFCDQQRGSSTPAACRRRRRTCASGRQHRQDDHAARADTAGAVQETGDFESTAYISGRRSAARVIDPADEGGAGGCDVSDRQPRRRTRGPGVARSRRR
jgi:2-methylaconitate cis-trans-isomerase PrpF